MSRNAVYILGSRGLDIGVRLVYITVLAAYLGPELYGLLNYGISWYLAFLPLTSVGIGVILSREVGRNGEQAFHIVQRTFSIRIFLAFFAALICATAGLLFEKELQVRLMLLLFSAALLGRTMALWCDMVFTAYEDNRYSFQQQALFRTFEVILGLLIVIGGYGVMAVAALHAISWWLQALRGLFLVGKKMAKVRLDWAWGPIKRILSQGLPVWLGGIIGNWILHGPLVMYKQMGGSENSLGQLALSMQALQVLCTLPTAAGTAALPVLSRAVVSEDGREVQFAHTILRASLIFGSAAGLAAFVMGPWVVNLVFGSAFYEAGQLLAPVVWILVPWTCVHAFSEVCFARGEFFLPTFFVALAAIIMTIGIWFLVPVMGIAGAILAVGIGVGIQAFIFVARMAILGELKLREVILRPVTAALAGIFAYFILQPANMWLGLTVGWIVLAGATWTMGVFTPRERLAFRALIRGDFHVSGLRQV